MKNLKFNVEEQMDNNFFDLKKSTNEELSTWLILKGIKIFEIEKNQFCRHVASDTNLIFWKKIAHHML